MAELVSVDTKQIMLRIRLPRSFGFRMWLTAQLLKFAGLVAPVTIEVSIGED